MVCYSSPGRNDSEGTQDIIGDMEDNETCRQAVKGCDFVYFIGPAGHPKEGEFGIKMIDAAKEQGVPHFIFSSVTHPQQSSLLQHTQKLRTEEHLINSKMDYTILQPCHYHHNFNIDQVLKDEVFSMFYEHDKKLSLVDCEDVAEVAAKVINDPQKHNRATYELIGPDILTSDEMAEIFIRETGIRIQSRSMPVEDFIAGLGEVPEYTKEMFRHLSATYNSNVLEWLLGRKPTSFTEYVHREMSKLLK